MVPTVPVLVVEDDPLIQELLADALEEGGFEINVASTGEQAAQMLEAEAAGYRALITDVNLPGQLTGWNVAKRARELTEELPVIYITGASAHDWASSGVPKSILVVKPFAPAQVVTAVSQLLNAASESPT